jgi:hypothetical protein
MALMDLYRKYMYGTPERNLRILNSSGGEIPNNIMKEPTQGLFGTGGEKTGGLIDFNKMNNQPGGLLRNIPQTALLGSAIFGQGIQGKDPFSALLPAVTQTAQLQKLMTPKKGFRILTEAEKKSVPGIDMNKTYQINTGTKQISQLSGTGTNVTVNTPRPETQEEKDVGKVFGAEFGEINKAGNLANVNDQKLEILMNLNESENLQSGKFGEFRTEAQKLAEEFGFDPGLQDTTVAELVSGVSGGLVLDGLQKFSGAISDGERNYTKSITPGLSTTKEGNRYLLQINKRQNELAKEYSNVANDWISRNGGLSKKDKELGSWGSYKKQWHESNPLINPEMKKTLTDLSKTVDTEFGNNIKTITRNGKQIKGVKIDGNWYEL